MRWRGVADSCSRRCRLLLQGHQSVLTDPLWRSIDPTAALLRGTTRFDGPRRFGPGLARVQRGLARHLPAPLLLFLVELRRRKSHLVLLTLLRERGPLATARLQTFIPLIFSLLLLGDAIVLCARCFTFFSNVGGHAERRHIFLLHLKVRNDTVQIGEYLLVIVGIASTWQGGGGRTGCTGV